MGRVRVVGRRATDARGGRQLRQRRHFRVVAAGTRRRRFRLRLARPRARLAARARDQRRPGHRDHRNSRVAFACAPRGPARGSRRSRPMAGRTPELVREFAHLSREVAATRGDDGEALREPSGLGHVARQQRVRLPQRALLLRCVRRRVPRVVDRAVRRHRNTQRGLGHVVLEPALLQLRRDSAAAHCSRLAKPVAGARLQPVQLGHHARPAEGGDGRAPSRDSRHPHNDEPDGCGVQLARQLEVRKRTRRGVDRPLPRVLPGPARRVGDERRSRAWTRRR